MDAWQVYPRSCAEKGRAANRFGEAMQVEESESGGGLICWDGKNTSGSSRATDFDFFGGKQRLLALVQNNAFRVGDETISANACWRGFLFRASAFQQRDVAHAPWF
jgi:hypothetical protein